MMTLFSNPRYLVSLIAVVVNERYLSLYVEWKEEAIQSMVMVNFF